MARKLTLYRDDSTTQVVFENVKHYFWLGNNTILAIAQYTDKDSGAHRYIMWPRERFCWFKDEPEPTVKVMYMGGTQPLFDALRGEAGDSGVQGPRKCGMHKKADGCWGCLQCDVSYDDLPATHEIPCVAVMLSGIKES